MREDILAGRLEQGTRLVECDLTARFGVSRGPVREALRRLAAEGLIEHTAHRGAEVRRLSARAIAELFQIRVEMEALAARLAAERADEDARASFFAAIAPIFDERRRAGPGYFAENAAFHDSLMALAGNAQLSELSSRLRLPLIMAQVGDVLTPAVVATSIAEHRAIAEAILRRDAEAAAAAMRAHLRRAAKLAAGRRAAANDVAPPLT